MDWLVTRIGALPLLVALMLVASLAMLVPAAYAWTVQDFADMRAFLFSGGVLGSLSMLVAIATASTPVSRQGRARLLHLFGGFVLIPLMLAIPVQIAVPDTSFLNAYAEMVSCLTTTGAPFFDDPERLSATVHLWRGLVGWLGGFFIIVSAAAILAPLSLGGFDVLTGGVAGQGNDYYSLDGSRRFLRFTVHLAPIYFGFTLALWLALTIGSRSPLIDLIHAMSVVSTSGITPIGGGPGFSNAGVGGEIIVFLFLLIALTRLPYNLDRTNLRPSAFFGDPELRMGLFLVAIVSLSLFARHWVGALEVDELSNFSAAMAAMWGSAFTVLSFLSTTGFESVNWANARDWSGLATPGILLLGLALIGGGVATTAGGVKLLRVYALYLHGRREMERLVHPSSIAGAGNATRRLRRQGAYTAWVFFMLFALSLTAVVLALAATGLNLDEAITLAISALSTTGPVAYVALQDPIAYGLLSDAAKLIMIAAMVLGRLETLVIIAMFNPDFWRK